MNDNEIFKSFVLASGKNFSVGSNVGINGNYTMGSCWIYYTGGIATI